MCKTVFFVGLAMLLMAHTTDNTIMLEVHGMRNSKGHVLVSVFDDAAGFPDDAARATKKLQLDIRNGKALFSLSGLPDGEYAVAVLHDENDDGKLNTNWIGLPKEGFGFSNNVMGMFGPPSFHKAKVKVSGGRVDVKLRMKYF